MLPIPWMELFEVAEAPASVLLAGAAALVLIEAGIALAALVASVSQDNRRG